MQMAFQDVDLDLIKFLCGGLTNDLIDFLYFSAHQFIQIKVLVGACSNNFFAVRREHRVRQWQIREEDCLKLFIFFSINLYTR